MFKKARLWLAAHPNTALMLMTIAALAPFIAKPFNIDDPMFLWVAKQVLAAPANPYGFIVNWYGWDEPVWMVMESPPLNSYFIALAAKILGWSEVGLHLVYLLPAIAVVLGTYRLAKSFCAQPMLAAALTLFTPVFLVSANTVMCDVSMLAFWVWSLVFWVEGIRENKPWKLATSGTLISLAILTKFNGSCLVPLAAAYGLAFHRKPGRWLLYLLIPVVAGLAYEVATQSIYGHGLATTAVGYSATTKAAHDFSIGSTTLIALTFAGGCVATALFLGPLIWRPMRLMLLFGGALFLVLIFGESLMGKYPLLTGKIRTLAEIQVLLWVIGGLSVLLLAGRDVWQNREANSLMLFLWVLGIFVFAGFINWTVTGRSVLPMTPAVAILLVRALDHQRKAWAQARIYLSVAAVFALLVAHADYLSAVATRQSAQQIWARYGQPDHTLWFEGHWGFQYYMDARAKAVDLDVSPMKSGDVFVAPLNNTNIKLPRSKISTMSFVEVYTVPKGKFLTTTDLEMGASFYASILGPLPFAFGDTPPEKVVVFRVN
jgi:4-amino-4-deoxy-L-arabinose transferase-like glycosyltransferase